MKRRRARHGNSLEYDNDHHLYGIYDYEQKTMFKFGISDGSLDAKRQSARMRQQVGLFNQLVNGIRFVAQVLLAGIPGRKAARKKEDEAIQAYQKKHGSLPRGNKNHKFLK